MIPRVAKMLRKFRFMLLVTDKDRANYLSRKKLFRGIGKNVYFQPRALPNDPKLILFHNNISVASGVTFVSHDVIHRVLNIKNNTNIDQYEGCIEILDNVFIGSNSIILPDVRIGPNVIVAAGSVITKDVPEGVIVAGSPARVIGRFEDFEKRRIGALQPETFETREMKDEKLWAQFWNKRVESE